MPKLAHVLSGMPAAVHLLHIATRAHGTHEQFSPMPRQRFMASAHVALWPLTVVSRRKVATQRAQYLELLGSQALEWTCAAQAEQHTRLAPAFPQTAGSCATSRGHVYHEGAPSVCSSASSSVHVLTW